NQVWGPGADYQLVLGPHAPGFTHVFAGSSTPLRTPLGSVHGRVVWGSLRQSDYASTDPADSRRFMAGWVGSYSPPGLPTLELGAARFYHLAWPQSGDWASTIRRPFESFLGTNVARDSVESNQLAAVFARWIFPTSGVEIYGEFAREDHAYRFRDALLEPDH